MLKLLLMAIGLYLGIMFCVASVSAVFRSLGVFGLVLLVACFVAGCWIAASGDKNKREKEDEENQKREETAKPVSAQGRQNQRISESSYDSVHKQSAKVNYVFGQATANEPNQLSSWIDRVTDPNMEKYIRDTLLWISRRPIVPYEHPQTDEEVLANEEAKKLKLFHDKDGLVQEIQESIKLVGNGYGTLLNILDAQRILMANRGKLTLRDARDGIRFEPNMRDWVRGEKYDLTVYMVKKLREHGIEDALYIGNHERKYCIADKSLCSAWNSTTVYLKWEPALDDEPHFETNADRLDWLDKK